MTGTVRVRLGAAFYRPGSAHAFAADDELDLPEAEASELIGHGLAREVGAAPAAEAPRDPGDPREG